MKLSLRKPENICWFSVPFILITGLFTIDKVIDIQLHDTYYVISNLHLGIFFGFTLGLLGSGYWVVNKLKGVLLKPLSGLHLLLTIGGVTLILLLTSVSGAGPDLYAAHPGGHFIKTGLAGAIAAFTGSQLLYLFNLVWGYSRRVR